MQNNNSTKKVWIIITLLIIVAGMEVPCAFLHVAGLHVQLMRRLTSPNAPPR